MDVRSDAGPDDIAPIFIKRCATALVAAPIYDAHSYTKMERSSFEKLSLKLVQ